jgi:hypothetical protein
LTDSSLNTPTSWKWRFSPTTGILFKNGTDSTSKNPQVQFTKGGSYSITLFASNAIGEDQLTKINRVFVIDSIPMTVSIQSNPATVCVNDTFNITSSVNTNGNKVSLSYSWKKNGVALSNTQDKLFGLTPNVLDKYQLLVTSTTRCVTPSTAMSAIMSPKTTGVKTVVVSCNLDTLKAANVGPGTYNWYKNGTLVGSGQKFKPNQTGLYRCVYVENGCQSDSSSILILKSIGSKLPTNNMVLVYPNPANDQLIIKGMQQYVEIKIYNAVGRLVKDVIVDNAQIEMVMAVGEWTPGMYTVQCLNAEGSEIYKESILIKH